MLPSVRVLFLAMDAGDKFLIQKWAADGTLPCIGSLLGTGLVGETTSLEGYYEGSTWPSFYTGATPAHHGFHSLTQLHPGTYEFYRCYPGNFINQAPFWNYLSAAGRRVAILDIPLSGISPGLNGIQMVEWASHDGVYGFQTWPENLKWEVLARFGRHPLKRSCDSYRRTWNDFRTFRNRLIKGVQKKTELTIHYLKKGDWDFFAQVFSESHCVDPRGL
jgi:predicted AlkP superfamily phosphohydrolase/phosphomutase